VYLHIKIIIRAAVNHNKFYSSQYMHIWTRLL